MVATVKRALVTGELLFADIGSSHMSGTFPAVEQAWGPGPQRKDWALMDGGHQDNLIPWAWNWAGASESQHRS